MNPTATDYSRRLARVSLAIFAAALAVGVYAALERRGLHADGALYLSRLLTREEFDLAEPARRTALAILQAPALLAIRSGWFDLAGVSFVFTLTLELVPLGLVAACYFVLPAGRKHFFYFPLLHYLAGTLSASASPIAESLAAHAYFWPLFYLVLFRPLRPLGFAVVFVLAAPVLYLHEAMGIMSLPIAAAAAWRAWREPGRPRRAAFALLALWFLAMAAVQTHNILAPNSVPNRTGLIEGVVSGWFLLGLEGEINLPAWLGLLGLGVALVINLNALSRAEGGREPRWIRGLVGALAALAAVGVGVAAVSVASVHPGQQFCARVNPAVISMLFMPGLLFSVWAPAHERCWARRSTIAVCAILGASGLAWQAIEVRNWSIYLDTLRKVLAESKGLVAPRDIEAGLSGRERVLFRNMSWQSIFPELSVVIAPGGKVSSIIATARPEPWRSWFPEHPKGIPPSRFFDTSAYRAAMAAGPPARAR